MHHIVEEDQKYVWDSLTAEEKDFFTGSVILLTGCAGFLGYSFLHFFSQFADELEIDRIIGLENFILGRPAWLDRVIAETRQIEIHEADIRSTDLGSVEGANDVDIVIHMASIASPAFYRKYPIETLEANIWGLRALLDYYKDRALSGFLFFSSSEIYGDPLPEFIPTDENYRGNVASIGPRACYDEAKRCGETMCYLYAERFELPITVVRPFNNFGPGMRLNDKRVPADFAQAVFADKDIEIFSDGSPTRTFCYVADALVGYLKSLALGRFDYFNIGISEPEISVRELAEIFQEVGRDVSEYRGNIKLAKKPEEAYLTDNPNRRCPNVEKAHRVLGYEPKILVDDGVRRFMRFIFDMKGGM